MDRDGSHGISLEILERLPDKSLSDSFFQPYTVSIRKLYALFMDIYGYFLFLHLSLSLSVCQSGSTS